MPPAPKIPRQVKSRMVKESILNAASELIRNNGYEYVTVSNVCSAAGVSIGSFYHHFENKDELLDYYLKATFEEHREEFAQLQGEDVVGDVLTCYRIYSEFIIGQGVEFVRNYYTTKNKTLGSMRFSSTGGKKVSLPILERTIELIATGCENGDIRPGTDSDELGEDLCMLEKGVIFDWCICDGAYNLLATSRRIMKNYLRAYMTDAYLEKHPDTFA